MKSKILVVAVFCAAALVLVLALVLDFGGAPASITASKSAEPSTPAAAADTANPAAPADNSKEPDNAEAAAPSQKSKPARNSATATAADPKAKPTRPSWDPKPSASQTRLEVPEQPQATKFSLPETAERAPVLQHAPAAGVAEGKLTKGFPAAAVPLPKATTIVKSSVEHQAQLVIVGVEGRSSNSVDEVLAFYTEHFEKQSWLTAKLELAQGSTQLSGSFGPDSTTVTVRQLPTGATSIVAAGVFEIQE